MLRSNLIKCTKCTECGHAQSQSRNYGIRMYRFLVLYEWFFVIFENMMINNLKEHGEV